VSTFEDFDGDDIETEAEWKQLIPTLDKLQEMYPTLNDIDKALLAIFSGAKLSGTWEQKAVRYRKIRYKQLKDPSFALECLISKDAAGKPETMKFHGKTFNFVDRIDLMMSFLHPPRTESPYALIIFYLLRLSIVQSHSLLQDSIWDYNGYDVEKYQSDTEYRQSLYKEQRDSIVEFHEKLVENLKDHEQEIKDSLKQTRKQVPRKHTNQDKTEKVQKRQKTQ